MERREFVAGISGIVSLSGVAGCQSLVGNGVEDSDGDGVVDSEDYAPNDPDVQEKSDITNSGSVDSNEDSTETDNSELIGKTVGNYKSGYEGFEVSKDLLGTALDSIDKENYQLAALAMEGFESDTEVFATSFSDAADAAERLGDTKVMKSALAGKAVVQLLGDAGAKVKKSAESADKENWDEADEYAAQAQSFLKQAINEEKDVMKPSAVESRLM